MAVGEPVADGIGRIPGLSNSYVLDDPSGTIVIDATISKKAKPVRRAFERAGVPISTVRTLLLTHQHPDHVSGAASLRAASQAVVAAHAADAAAIDGRDPPKLPFLMRLLGMGAPPVALQRLLADHDTLGPLRVVFVPGHTPGEVAFYDPVRKILFSGDSVVERSGALILPGRRYASDLRQAIASLAVLRALDVELLLPGHGVPVRTDVAGALDALIARAPREYLGA